MCRIEGFLVLRFGSARPSKTGLSAGERLRLGMLLLALGVVIVAMQQIRRPSTVEKLDRMFRGPALPAQSEVSAGTIEPTTKSDLSDIEDNTFFRPEEREAWFDMFANLRDFGEQQLATSSVGEMTYAQLLQQPDVYRGKVVTLRGTVLREDEQHPEENSQGIGSYHRLWLQPRGGGQWPFVVFALNLPDDFPRGDDLHAEATVTGLFFKNWSYSYDDGMGLAPVVLAKGVDWQRPAASMPTKRVNLRGLVWMATGAALFALVTVWLAIRKTLRPPRHTQLPDSISVPVDETADAHGGEQS